jgi:sec-independent protein translocase protein TatC
MSTMRSPPERGGPRLTLAGHLEELRRRLAVGLAALLVAVGVSLTQVERIIRWLQRPAEGLLPQFAFFSPAEPLLAYLKVGVLTGLILAMPVLLGQLWGFARTGLTPVERAWGRTFVWWGSIQFLAGAVFAYFIVLPISLRVLLGVGRNLLIPVVSIDRYLAFVTSLVFWCGLAFGLLVALFILAKVGIVTPEWLRQQRPLAMLSIAIIGALVTPTTDPITMLLVCLPLAVFYELAVVLTRLSVRWR